MKAFDDISRDIEKLTQTIAKMRASYTYTKAEIAKEQTKQTACNQVKGGFMHNPILNQKMRLVDLGVVTCIDSVIRHCETLLKENSSEAEQTRAKAQIRLNAGIYPLL